MTTPVKTALSVNLNKVALIRNTRHLGIPSVTRAAALCLQAIRDERFLVLPHPEVATYMERKATDRDRWLAGMRRFQSALHPDGNLPGDVIAPKR